MNIREGILDSLIDDGESIIQINKYLNFLGLFINKEELVSEIKLLYKQNKINIEYPPEAQNIAELNDNSFDGYWFGLTEKGRSEWKMIKE